MSLVSDIAAALFREEWGEPAEGLGYDRAEYEARAILCLEGLAEKRPDLADVLHAIIRQHQAVRTSSVSAFSSSGV